MGEWVVVKGVLRRRPAVEMDSKSPIFWCVVFAVQARRSSRYTWMKGAWPEEWLSMQRILGSCVVWGVRCMMSGCEGCSIGLRMSCLSRYEVRFGLRLKGMYEEKIVLRRVWR
jgi:hypothetical protein